MRRRRSPKEIDDYKRKWKLGKYNIGCNQKHSRWCIDNGYRIYNEYLDLADEVNCEFINVVNQS